MSGRVRAFVIPLPRRVSARRAAAILERVFGRVATGFAFRLWDGTPRPARRRRRPCARPSSIAPRRSSVSCTIPRPLEFAEAYVDGAIDIEGDLFAAMRIADAMEDIRLSRGDRLRILLALWRG